MSTKNKINKMNALVWNKGLWSLHLFTLLPALRKTIDGVQARLLRRILEVPASFSSCISHATVRRRCTTFRFSKFIFRSQLRWLGHILRKPPSHPLRLVLFSNPISLTSAPAVPPPFILFAPRQVSEAAPIWIGGKIFCIKSTASAAFRVGT